MYNEGPLIIEGKTKQVYVAQREDGTPIDQDGDALVIVNSKDDITAGDGAKHDLIAGKGAISNQTTVNIFSLLRTCGLPLAFVEGRDETSFVARNCTMIPLEVIVRREAHGSYCRRYPHVQPHTRFSKLRVEFNLKTTGRKWGGMDLPCDDPLIGWVWRWQGNPGSMQLSQPSGVAYGAKPFASLPWPEFCTRADIDEMATLACEAFLLLEKSWQMFNIRFVDYKVEFGRTTSGELVLADVIDADSGRLVGSDGKYLDKQVYREGGTLQEVWRNFIRIRDMTSHFVQPQDTLVFWRASERDDFGAFMTAYNGLMPRDVSVSLLPTRLITCSAHKETDRSLTILRGLQVDHPNSVILAYVGRSNGLGPVLAGNANIPVICVPASAKEFPDDVWSSLRMPSGVACSVILDPANAVLHALQILARNNPFAYMVVESRREGFYEIC